MQGAGQHEAHPSVATAGEIGNQNGMRINALVDVRPEVGAMKASNDCRTYGRRQQVVNDPADDGIFIRGTDQQPGNV